MGEKHSNPYEKEGSSLAVMKGLKTGLLLPPSSRFRGGENGKRVSFFKREL